MKNLTDIIATRYKNILVIFVFLVFLGMSFSVMSTSVSQGASLSSFKGGNEYNLTFKTSGIDASPTFSIENKVPIIDAQLQVSTADNGDGNYPQSPRLDVGIDGDTEWAYKGDGYGQFGNQYTFTDNTTASSSEFTAAGGTKTTANFMMPKGATATSASMDVRGRFVPTGISDFDISQAGLRYPRASHSGNIDNANNNDVVVVNYDYYNGEVVLFKNPSPATGAWAKSTIGSSLRYPYDVQIGTIQETITGQTGGDDVVITSYDYSNGAIYWYSNTNNNGNTWSRYTIASGMRYPAFVRIADMDLDGDNDVVVACSGYYTYYSTTLPMVCWYENDGTPKTGTWARHTIYAKGTSYYDGYIRSMDVGFFDSDAYPDVAWGCYYDIFWAKNPQSPTGTWNRYEITTSTYYYYSYGMVAADVNGDGYDDLATCSGYSGTGYGVAWWKNPTTTSSWTKYSIDTSARYGYDIDASNLDGANTVDFIVTCYGYSSGYDYIYRYLSTSTNPTTSWTKQTISSNSFKSPATVTISNFDGATRDDFFVASYYTGSASWYANNGAATVWTQNKIIEGGVQDPWGMAKGDFDGDLDLDIVVCGYGSDEVRWYENDGTPSVGTWPSHAVDSNADAASLCEVVDIDGDGDDDIIATHYRAYRLVLYINNGAGVFTKKIIASSLIYVYPVGYGDIDGDGHIDIVTSTYYSSYGGLMWFEAPNTPTGTWIKRTIDGSANYVKALDVGDMDNDGDLDVAVATYSYSGGVVKWYECPANPASSSSWASTDIQTNVRYAYDMELADFDGDGQLDVVYTSMYYHIYWNSCPKNPKTTPWPQYTLANFQSTYYYCWQLDVEDIGDDGYYDIAFTTYYSDRVYWAEEPDDPTELWKLHVVDTNMDYAEGVVIGDFDGDGVDDIAATGRGMEEVKWYQIQTQYCQDAKVDIGGDLSYEWQTTGETKGVYHFEFKDSMNALLSAAGTGTTDAYGNEMVPFKVNLNAGPSAGKLAVFNMSVEYEYTATVDVNPHNTNLAAEIQELLDNDQSGADSVDMFIAVGSASPGKLRVHDLEINYNAHPDLEENIPTIKIDEDSANPNVLDLSDYFSDDFDAAADLSYTIKMSSAAASKVTLSIQGTMLSATTVVPNWNGEVAASITATDNGDGVSAPTTFTASNEFTITVDPVNDEPVLGDVYVPNAKLNEDSFMTWVKLDSAKYFTDIEGDELFYKAEVDPDGAMTGEDITVGINADNYIVITSNGDFTGDNIPVRIYCDDDKTFGELDEVNPYQDFKVTVSNLPDDPPFWSPIDPIYIPEDSEMMEVLDLTEYINDLDTPLDQIDIYLNGNTNSSWLPASIDQDGILSVASSQPDYDGSTMITVKAWDGYNYGLATVWIYVIPENDLPTVAISVPSEGEEIIAGNVFTLIGSARDPEDLQKVEIGFAEKGKPATEWVETKGLSSWKYDWNTADLEPGTEFTIYARSYDGIEYSEYDFVNVKIKEVSAMTLDTDRDGRPDQFDAFPNNPFEWEDKDGDGHGDNQDDLFPDDKTEWADADHDGIGDNSDPTPNGEKNSDTIGGTDYQDNKSEGFKFNLWWLVVLLVIIEVLFLVFLFAKKIRSKRPVPKKKVIQKQKKQA